MKTTRLWLSIVLMCTLLPVAVKAQQNDTTINRNVVVEREFQPVIQHAGKLNTTLQQVETRVEPVNLSFSDYSEPFSPALHLSPLAASTIRFAHPQPTNGHITVVGGYPCSYLDFAYEKEDKKNQVELNVWANHEAQWGIKTNSFSSAGLRVSKTFNRPTLFFDVAGSHLFFTRYGRYYESDKNLSISRYNELKSEDKQQAWDVAAQLGLHASSNSVFPYSVAIGYTAYVLPQWVTEHAARAYLWTGLGIDEHMGAIDFTMQSTFMAVDKKTLIPDSLYGPRHGFRIHPYYEYKTDNIKLHAGVNLDLNIGTGQQFSSLEDISFAPSPDIEVEYRIIPSWLAVYAQATGQFSYGTVKDYIASNHFRNPEYGIVSRHVSAYTPVDANVGFKIKPVDGLFFDIHGGYARLQNAINVIAPTVNDLKVVPVPFLEYEYADYNRWRVGAEMTYHYRDIIHFALEGHYYNYMGKAYDRPDWDAALHIHANIDSKWSIYSDNCFAGKRTALLSDKSTATLKPTIDLSLGVRYNVNRWLYCYAELNNYLHRYNDIYYGYQSQGINGRIGISWRF